MFTAAALIPSPPLLIPELAGGAATETDELRLASKHVAARLGALATRWTAIGVGRTECEIPATAAGTFRGYGADVRVALSPAAAGLDPELPLAALMAGWLRAAAPAETVVDAIIVAEDTSPVYCAELGARLRDRLEADPRPHGVLVVADGARTLTAKAPGSFDERAPEAQAELDRALDSGDAEYLAELDPVVCLDIGIEGRAAWQVLAGLFRGAPSECRTYYRGAPFGVGYHVGMWLP
ncbi:hypothetical protein ABIC28_001133 [Rhodococcus sp. PvR044]|uniref:class III extradiol dioxygenase subunit B-like domain-containing protein n=1 Tax=unclassified Rhodococcus (in: high G+C Gram-positive bacteria) TaxID=192944 RepID=UPI000BD1DF13|nr:MULTISPECIES: class III extradiol dioxygenase subunit B-like domain-containing protein [unclassified Rhodococcus (in: high G+C Gram-positive bacteria)]MBP1158364.1 hypothetical protein [Rhodococcus sp. PvR099]PTR43789.1 hypothetical protein C8K38_106142 [Rhodococcus sp. OK611]SNX90607.1 hypothetical protein SAMN05447004_106142 [Rhodococcus sp. OK270]